MAFLNTAKVFLIFDWKDALKIIKALKYLNDETAHLIDINTVQLTIFG